MAFPNKPKSAPAKSAPVKSAPAKRATPAPSVKPATSKAPAKQAPVRKPAARGATKALTAEQKKELRMHSLPADFAPFAMHLTFKVGKDGYMYADKMTLDRIKGRWDNDDAKRFDMFEYDQRTAAAVVARFTAATSASNPLRRLPAGATFSVFYRVAKNKDEVCIVSIKAVERASKGKWVPLEDKTDPVLRLIRRSAVLLRGAFTDVQLPPAGKRAKKSDDE